jgi:A/G-specific adenine glycosylase
LRSKKRIAEDNAPRRRPPGARPPRLDAVRVATFRRRLLAWYRRRGRDLPWRRTRDPYEILVSEVMLQQTQVQRVLEFYPRFLARYPTAADLASASASAVREAWDGLGYYRRARNLHRTARVVVRRHAGRFPSSPAELERLPGVGRYTAGAVATFAYGVDAPILDTNAARVLQRVFGPGRRRRRTARLWALAEAVLPPGEGYAFNQAIMDLGAMVCTARRPACPDCPVRIACGAYGRGWQPGAPRRPRVRSRID